MTQIVSDVAVLVVLFAPTFVYGSYFYFSKMF
jgi:hypothetical protein